MFTIPAIHHNSSKADDSPLGGMHLNAINGSSDFFGSNTLGGGSYFNQPKTHGGLYGVSLSDNHPYRPTDSGSCYQDFGQQTSSALCPSASETSSARNGNKVTSANVYQTTTRQRQALECLRDSLRLSPDVPRRHSLDLEKTSASCRHYDEELLLTLDELDLDLASLNITEVDADTGEDLKQDPQKNDPLQQSKRRRYHTTDSATAERAIKLLAKIKESRKQNNNDQKPGKHREVDDVTQHLSAALTSKSTSGSSRHGVQRHWSETCKTKDKTQPPADVRRPKDKKLLSRASFD
ncbi:hypothetical protein Btru_034861 [Bulinus truncatus]|nr:hypothetical protein Btru_034861 [Bulinus truncatus]